MVRVRGVRRGTFLEVLAPQRAAGVGLKTRHLGFRKRKKQQTKEKHMIKQMCI